MADIPPPEGIVLAHFIVSDDVERSRRFYSEVLGGRVVFSGDVTYVALANSWIRPLGSPGRLRAGEGRRDRAAGSARGGRRPSRSRSRPRRGAVTHPQGRVTRRWVMTQAQPPDTLAGCMSQQI